MVCHSYLDCNAFNMVNKIYHENPVFRDWENEQNLKMKFFGVSQNTPVSREHVLI